jgi:hypothetical protein
MAAGNWNNTDDSITDENGDLDVNAPNPVNINPQFMGDYPKPKPTTSKIPEMTPSSEGSTINHPPKPPGTALGPYFQFITTDLKTMLWMGSVLIFRDVSFDQPKMEFICDAKVDYNWEILYENLFNLRAYRVNLFIELRSGEGNDKVIWKIDWGDKKTDGLFLIARHNQKWRGGFFSCNGFGVAVSKKIPSNMTYSNVWDHLLSVHEETPLHLLLWGGDQNYIDFIFQDIPYLRDWVNMEWNEKWTCDFRNDLKEQIEQYYFNAYAENWENRPEMKKALASIPSLMMWDDHDIFDGAGTYPPLLHDSPMMMGLFLVAQKIRLLFQHHTTLEKARQHRMFGYQGYNFFARCGRNLAIIGADGRTERDTQIVQHEKTWDMIFDKLENDLEDVEHLIVLFPVPFSFIRIGIAESIFERLKNLPNKWRNVPLVKQTNSIFGLPDMYDDLLDEWTHAAHIDERNRALIRFQQISEKKKVRITYFSGDVHCCGISRFQSRGSHRLLPINDTKLMYQIISSAIVNLPPSEMAIRIAHLFKTKWNPVDNTEEELIDFFERNPENGRKLFYKKLRPNRNWCYFEQCSNIMSSNVTVVQTRCLHCFPSKENLDNTINLGSNSNQDGNGGRRPSNRDLRPELIQADQQQIETNDLRIRLWLEGVGKHRDETQFVGYDLLIPSLK